MKPHPRIRKTVKWGGAAVTVLLGVVWIASLWICIYFSAPHLAGSVQRGHAGYSYGPRVLARSWSISFIEPNRYSFAAWFGPGASGGRHPFHL